jgi:vacuolar protein-sorting-associated protein 4
MQGVGNSNDTGVLVLGATNLPWSLDTAIRRRFEKRIYISLPEAEARLSLLKNSMKNEEHNLTEADFKEMADRTDLFSGSDLSSLIKNACFEPLRKFQNAIYFLPVGKNPQGKIIYTPCAPSEKGAVKLDKDNLSGLEIKKNIINKYDFLKAIENTKPTVSVKDLVAYENWTKEFGMDG